VVNRGEIWWAESPSDKRRPYLVLTRQAAIPVLNAVIAVPATRRMRGIPTEVALDAADGMPEPCALSFDNIVTMPKAWLVERICRLAPDRLHDVCRALEIATGCG
jgi:mRNA interferase MazF